MTAVFLYIFSVSAKHFIIRGKVQGVFFRATTQEMAEALGLTGWVRNCSDGSVEVHAEGDEEQVQALYEWLQKGPDAARVDEVVTEDVQEENYREFSLLPEKQV